MIKPNTTLRKNSHIIPVVLLATAFSFVAKAQQIPAYHHYFLNGMVYNPAATGYYTSTNAFFMRSQRNMDFEGGNIVNALTVDGSLFENKLGLGISLYSDVMGASSGAGGNISASYKIKFSEESYMRFGVAAGGEDHRINFNQAIVKDPNDKQLNNGNPGRKFVANASAGLLFQIKKLQIGVSVPQLLGLKSDFKALINDGSSNGGSYTFERHFVGQLRYDFSLGEKLGLTLSPFAMAKYIPGAPFQYDGGLVVDFRDFVWINGTYKSGYAVTAAIGFKIKKSICIGYAYDVVMNSTKSYAGINQEILVGYRFPVKGGDNSKEKKELEEARKENERLQQELLVKQSQNDSIAALDRKNRAEAADKYSKKETEMSEMEKTKNDSINKLNELLSKKNEVRPENTVKNDVVPPKNDPPVIDNSQIKRSENDYFVELDQSDSPQGLYVVFGAFSKDEGAQEQLNRYKKDFPEARMIINRRNGYKYIVFKYANRPEPVFEVLNKAKSQGLNKAWILQYIR